MRLLVITFLLLAFVTSCAIGPKFDAKTYQHEPAPNAVSNNIQATQGAKVLWGGIIINQHQGAERAQLEILAYPLDSKQKPDVSKAPMGRYLAIKDDYLEITDFNQGRLITTIGTINDVQPGLVGQATLVYPIIEIKQIHLWPLQSQSSEPKFHIGVGVMFSN